MTPLPCRAPEKRMYIDSPLILFSRAFMSAHSALPLTSEEDYRGAGLQLVRALVLEDDRAPGAWDFVGGGKFCHSIALDPAPASTRRVP